MQGFKKHLEEKLKASDDMGDWVKDFQDSDAPQFKGKSQKKRQQMAVAAKLAAERNEEIELDESNLTSDDLHRIAKDHDSAAKKHGTAYKETRSSAASRNHEVAYNRHVDAARAHREAAKDKNKHSGEKLEKMSNHAWDASDHVRKHFDESVELDEVSQDLARKTAKARQQQASQLRQKAVDEPDMMKAFAQTKAANKAEKKAGQSYNRLMKKEEVEQIDEISRDLATRAAQGFADKADKAHAKKDYAGFKKGEAGRKLAIAKLQGRTKVPAVARRVEEVELDEQTQYDLVEAYLLENNIDVDTLSIEQLDEIIGKVVGGAFKLGAKAVVGAGRLAKKAIVNKQGNIRGTQAAKNDAMKAKLDKLRKQRATEVQRQKLKKDVERAQAKLSATKSRA
jgi:hypothetical protein